MRKPNILWIDDEIDGLESLVLFLSRKGYTVTTAASGMRGVEILSGSRTTFDLVLLDEMMPGMDGIETLQRIRDHDSSIPVIMVTKSEDEKTMDAAFGRMADDYLIKPVKPHQILSVCKKHLDRSRLRETSVSESFASYYIRLQEMLARDHDWSGWCGITRELTLREMEIDRMGSSAETLASSLAELKSSFNAGFARFIEAEYPARIAMESSPELPPLSHELLERKAFPLLGSGEKLVVLILDCMRLDHWIAIEPALKDYFDISTECYYSILPSATPYSRNALFAGKLPRDILEQQPEFWDDDADPKNAPNRFEEELLRANMARHGLETVSTAFFSIHSESAGSSLADKLPDYKSRTFLSIVYSFMDILTHSRSESHVLREIIPDEKAFRSLAESWFAYSQLRRLILALGRLGYSILCASDHGSIFCSRAAKVVADRRTTTHLRYKRGTNIKTGSRFALDIRDSATWGLPSEGIMINYLVAKEDYFLIYANDFSSHRRLHKGSFLHGGISLEELVLPCVLMHPR